MTIPEYILIGFTALGAVFGYMRGFLKQVSSLLGLLIGYFAAVLLLSQSHQFFLKNGIVSETSSLWISFVLTVIIVFLSVKFLSGLIEKALNSIGLDFTNKFAGMMFGALKYFLIIMIIFCFLFTAGIISEKNSSSNLLDFISLFKTILFLYIL